MGGERCDGVGWVFVYKWDEVVVVEILVDWGNVSNDWDIELGELICWVDVGVY